MRRNIANVGADCRNWGVILLLNCGGRLSLGGAIIHSGMSSILYPIGLNIRGRKCVVVGGGAVGTRKALALREAGAAVMVIAPEATETLRNAAAQGTFEYQATRFSPESLCGAFLVVAATDSAEVNVAVANAARERGVLLNFAGAADAEDNGDFVTMAAVRRGDLLVALTTGGAGPAITARLRETLETLFGPEWSTYLELMAQMRETAKQTISDPKTRAKRLRELAARDDIRERIAAGEISKAREEAIACLSV